VWFNLPSASCTFGLANCQIADQAVTEYGKQIRNRGVTDQPHYVACSDQHRRTTFAALEMLLHFGAQAGTHFVIEVIRNLAPYLVAPHFHCSATLFVRSEPLFT
jgi:hypothetical protein